MDQPAQPSVLRAAGFPEQQCAKLDADKDRVAAPTPPLGVCLWLGQCVRSSSLALLRSGLRLTQPALCGDRQAPQECGSGRQDGIGAACVVRIVPL